MSASNALHACSWCSRESTSGGSTTVASPIGKSCFFAGKGGSLRTAKTEEMRCTSSMEASVQDRQTEILPYRHLQTPIDRQMYYPTDRDRDSCPSYSQKAQTPNHESLCECINMNMHKLI